MAAHCANHCLVGEFKIANFVQNVQHNRTSSKVLEKNVQSLQSTMQTDVENVPLHIVHCIPRSLATHLRLFVYYYEFENNWHTR